MALTEEAISTSAASHFYPTPASTQANWESEKVWNQREDQGTPPDQTNQFGAIGKATAFYDFLSGLKV